MTVRGGALYKEPLTPDVLTKKLDVWVSFEPYFERQEAGRYARKAG